jgi:WD40 repeat protein
MLRMLRPALSRSRHHTGAIAGMKFSPNGQRPATPGPDHAIKSWDAEELINSRTLRAHTNWVSRAGQTIRA